MASKTFMGITVTDDNVLSGPPPEHYHVTLILAEGMPMPYYVANDYEAWMGRCDWSVTGWDLDARPIWAIPEVMSLLRKYLRSDPAFPALLDVGHPFKGLHMLCAVMGCVGGSWKTNASPIDRAVMKVDLNQAIAGVVIPAWNALAPRIGEKAAATWATRACESLMGHCGVPQAKINEYKREIEGKLKAFLEELDKRE